MSDTELQLPESVKRIELEDKEIYLVGTAHVSQESVNDVRNTIETVDPDTVCIELDEARYRSLTQKDAWKNMDIFKVIKEGKATLLLAQLIMTSFYRRLGDEIGVVPGAEFLEGARIANEKGANLVMADRDVQVTIKRVWRYLGFWHKIKLSAEVMAGLLVSEKIDSETIEKLKKQDQLEGALEKFAKSFPEIKRRLIDERDVYLAEKIRTAPGKKIVAAVGAGHSEGIQKYLHQENDLEPIMQIPPKSIWPKVIKWAIPAAIVALIVAGFFKSGTEHSIHSIYIWILLNGSLSALGVAVALGHPLTIAVAFVAAPLTSLNPMIAAGWVAGLVQAMVRRPTVADFENLPNAVTSFKGFWKNPVIKILMVVVLANLGSSVATFIAGGWIAGRTF